MNDSKSYPPALVITSEGYENDYWSCLGLYRWDDEKNCYKQVSTDLSKVEDHKDIYYTRDKYLYQANGSWYISDKLDNTVCFMKNPSKSSSVPLTGWMYYDLDDGDFYEDSDIKIKFGELCENDICDQLRIQFKGRFSTFNELFGGEYKKTTKYSQGKPIFINRKDCYLYSWNKGWSMGINIFIPQFFSKNINGFCPSQSTIWIIGRNAKSLKVIVQKIISVKSHEEYLVISGEGTGTQLRGDCLGMYQWDPEHCYYMQVSTEEHPDKTKSKRRYLYQADDECWYISSDPGKRKGLLKNFSKSSSVPLDGWMLMTNKSKLIKDSSAKIQFGRPSKSVQ